MIHHVMTAYVAVNVISVMYSKMYFMLYELRMQNIVMVH